MSSSVGGGASGTGTVGVRAGRAATAPAGAKMFDCDSALTTRSAQAFRAQGFSAAGRYLSRSGSEQTGDLSAAEALTILAAGLAIVPVQHVPHAGWYPVAELGEEYGADAALNAAAVGCPPGVVLWLDLEGVAPASSYKDVAAYCNAWHAAVHKAGYVSGLYVGVNEILSATQLYELLATEHYWHSGSRSAPIPARRGVQIVQTINASYRLSGVSYDLDMVQADMLGGLPVWWTI